MGIWMEMDTDRLPDQDQYARTMQCLVRSQVTSPVGLVAPVHRHLRNSHDSSSITYTGDWSHNAAGERKKEREREAGWGGGGSG